MVKFKSWQKPWFVISSCNLFNDSNQWKTFLRNKWCYYYIKTHVGTFVWTNMNIVFGLNPETIELLKISRMH